MRRMFKSKIHRATVTHADLHYEGSLSIDICLMEAANILQYEEVNIWNITRGTRLATYAIEAPKGSGIICANGAAAHLVKEGDLIIIATFTDIENVSENYQPTVIRVDEKNRPICSMPEIAGPAYQKSMISEVKR